MYEENQQCVKNCKVFQFENRCYDKCPSEAKFAYNGTCVRTCPLNASKVDEQKYDMYTLFVCMDSCPTDKLIFKNIACLVVQTPILQYTKENAYSVAN